MYFGHGFPWNLQCRRRADRAVAEGLDRRIDVGSWSLHGVGGIGVPVGLPERLLDQHVFLCGTTGSGKTRLLELLALQAIRRGEAVAVVDPKGDRELRRRVRPRYWFCPYDRRSVAYNPLGTYEEPRQIADRVAAMMPADGDAQAFRNFAWEVVAAAALAVDAAGERMTVDAIRRAVFESPEALARRVLRRRAPRLAEKGLEEYEKGRAAGKYAPVPGVDGMIRIIRHPRDHFQKLASGLGAILEKLTAGTLRRILSKDGFSWDRLVERREIAYFELGSLRGAETARAIARLALLDLAHAIGRWMAKPAKERRLSLFIDEFSDFAVPEFIDILNKARGCGVSITLATQTFSDLRAALGSEARAMQILGNASTIVQFRTHDESDAELFSALAGSEAARTIRRSHSFEPALFSSGSKWVDDFRATFAMQTEVRDEKILPAHLIARLPNLHAFGRIGGRLYKLIVPWIEEDGCCGHYPG